MSSSIAKNDVIPLADDVEVPPQSKDSAPQKIPLMATPAMPNQVWIITSKPSDDASPSTIKTFTDITSAIADILLPLIFLGIVIWLRKQLFEAMTAIVERIKDPTTSLKIGPLELQAKIKSLEENIQVLESVSLAIPSSTSSSQIIPISDELKNIASEYLSVNDSDRRKRVQKKVELAGKMALLVIQNGISRKLLAEDSNQGILMALATAVDVNPQIGDDQWIAIAAPKVKLLNVRYRFMMAIAKLAQLKLIDANRTIAFKKLCIDYRVDADDSLNDRINRTEAELNIILIQ